MSFVSNPEMPILRLSRTVNCTLRDACVGVHIFGGIGSGKNTGSGRALSEAYLLAGMGVVVLCAKPEVVQLRQQAPQPELGRDLRAPDHEHDIDR